MKICDPGWEMSWPLQWRLNEPDGVSNHRRLDCLLKRLFRRRSKKTSKLRVTAFVRGIHRWPVNSPHKGPVTRKMFPFDDVIMQCASDSVFVYVPLTLMWSSFCEAHFIMMMTSSNGNIFRVTGHLCGEFTRHRWIPRTKASDAEIWCFLWSAPE